MAEKELIIRMKAKDLVSRTTRGMSKAFGSLGKVGKKSLMAVGKAAGAAGRLIKGMLKPLALISTALGALGAGAFFAAIKSAANFGDEVQKMSQRLGISTELLSELRFQAELSGTNFASAASGYKLLAKNLFDASNGIGLAKDAFDQMGIQATDIFGKLRPIDEVVGELADKFSVLEDGTEKTALAMKIFGRSGADLIPMLNEGRVGLERMAKEARQLGIVIDQEAADKAANFNDQLSTLMASLRGLKFQFGLAFFDDLAEALRNSAFWIAKNRDRIVDFATSAMGLLGAAFKVIGAIITEMFSDNGKNVKALKRFFLEVAPVVIDAGLSIMVDSLRIGGAAAGAAFSLAMTNEMRAGWNVLVDDAVKIGLGPGGWLVKKFGFDPGDMVKLGPSSPGKAAEEFKEKLENTSKSIKASIASVEAQIALSYVALENGTSPKLSAALSELKEKYDQLKAAINGTSGAAQDLGERMDFNKNLQPASQVPFFLGGGFGSEETKEKVKAVGAEMGEAFTQGFSDAVEIVEGPRSFVQGFKDAANEIASVFADIGNAGAKFADDLHATLADSFFNQAKRGLKDFGEFFKNTFASILDGILRQITDFMAAQAVSGFASIVGNIFTSPAAAGGGGVTFGTPSIGNSLGTISTLPALSGAVSSGASAGNTFIINAVDASSITNLLTQNNGTIANNLVAAISTDNSLRGNLRGALG